MHFERPPSSLSLTDQQAWTERIQRAEDICGIRSAGMPLVTTATMELLQRYVVGELTLSEFVVLQSRRLQGS